MRVRLLLALLGLLVAVVACGDSGEGVAADGAAATGADDVTATTEADGATQQPGDDGEQAASGDGPFWQAEVTGAEEATIGNSEDSLFTGSWSAVTGDADAVELTMLGEDSMSTSVSMIFAASILDGGTFDLSEDLGPPVSFAVEGRSYTEDVQGSIAITSQAADGSISGTFEITATNGDTGGTATAAGEFRNIPRSPED